MKSYDLVIVGGGHNGLVCSEDALLRQADIFQNAQMGEEVEGLEDHAGGAPKRCQLCLGGRPGSIDGHACQGDRAYRRLVRDYEARTDVSEAMIYAAMSSLIIRRITH